MKHYGRLYGGQLTSGLSAGMGERGGIGSVTLQSRARPGGLLKAVQGVGDS